MFIEKYEGVTRINLYNGETLLEEESGVTVSSLLSGDWYFVPKIEVETNLGIDNAIASRPIQWGLAIDGGDLYKKLLFDEFTVSVDNGGTVCIHPIEKGAELDWGDSPIFVVAYIPQDTDESVFEILPVMDYRTSDDDDDDDDDAPTS